MIGVGFGLANVLIRRTRLIDLITEHPWLRWVALRLAIQRPASLSPTLAREMIPAMRASGFSDAIPSALEAVREAHATAVSCPTMIVWGHHDRFVPLGNAHDLHRSIPSSRLAVLDDVGHCAMFERPDVFTHLLLDFLTGPEPARHSGLSNAPGSFTERVDTGVCRARVRRRGPAPASMLRRRRAPRRPR